MHFSLHLSTKSAEKNLADHGMSCWLDCCSSNIVSLISTTLNIITKQCEINETQEMKRRTTYREKILFFLPLPVQRKTVGGKKKSNELEQGLHARTKWQDFFFFWFCRSYIEWSYGKH